MKYTCLTCGIEFERPKYRKSKYCSNNCVLKQRFGFKNGELNPSKNPETVKKISEKLKGRMPWNKGIKSPHPHTGFQKGHSFYKGAEKGWFPKWDGVTEQDKMDYLRFIHSDMWIDIRIKILKRDNNSCLHCGSKENLQVDHILPWLLSRNNSEENLQTLCKVCHVTKDNKLRRELCKK